MDSPARLRAPPGKELPPWPKMTSLPQQPTTAIRSHQRRLLRVKVSSSLRLNPFDASILIEALRLFRDMNSHSHAECDELISELARMDRVMHAASEA